MMASLPVTATLSGVTVMDSSVFSFIWFFRNYSLTRISAVILLFLPHNTVVDKEGLCYSNCRLRASDLLVSIRGFLHDTVRT